MKKISLVLFAFLFFTCCVFTACDKEDDTNPPTGGGGPTSDHTAPVISIIGSNPMTVTLNSGSMSDLGAIATDETDDSVVVSSTWNWGTNPNPDLAGSYTVTYSASDSAGNQATANRTVLVQNSAMNLQGAYQVTDSVAGVPTSYTQSIMASSTVDGLIFFNQFANYINNTGIYAFVSGNDIILPGQNANNIGSLSEDHQFNGSGAIVSTSPVVVLHLDYVDNNTSTSSVANCSAWFVKQP